MTATAIVMMLVMMLAIWGGLVAAIIWLVRNDRSTAGNQAEGATGRYSRDL